MSNQATEDLRNRSDHDLLILAVERISDLAINLDKLTIGLGSHEKRIGSLENWRAFITGAISIIGLVVIGLIIPLILRAWP